MRFSWMHFNTVMFDRFREEEHQILTFGELQRPLSADFECLSALDKTLDVDAINYLYLIVCI